MSRTQRPAATLADDYERTEGATDAPALLSIDFGPPFGARDAHLAATATVDSWHDGPGDRFASIALAAGGRAMFIPFRPADARRFAMALLRAADACDGGEPRQ